jgi:hypothetical protein
MSAQLQGKANAPLTRKDMIAVYYNGSFRYNNQVIVTLSMEVAGSGYTYPQFLHIPMKSKSNEINTIGGI